jgi:hypothetical protein
MRKYAALTALAIALNITMLTPAVSKGPLFRCKGGSIYGNAMCNAKCTTELWNTATLWNGTRNPPRNCPPLLQARIATCVTTQRATRH